MLLFLAFFTAPGSKVFGGCCLTAGRLKIALSVSLSVERSVKPQPASGWSVVDKHPNRCLREESVFVLRGVAEGLCDPWAIGVC